MITIDDKLCIKCESCVENCPTLSLKLDKYKNKIKINYITCIECESCIDSCPRVAVTINRNL